MNFAQYQEATKRTADPSKVEKDRISNYVFGLNGESGEVTELLKKYMYHHHPLDGNDLRKELGDVLWYLTRLADEFGLDLENIAEQNIEKLKARYPHKFDTQRSIYRKE